MARGKLCFCFLKLAMWLVALCRVFSCQLRRSSSAQFAFKNKLNAEIWNGLPDRIGSQRSWDRTSEKTTFAAKSLPGASTRLNSERNAVRASKTWPHHCDGNRWVSDETKSISCIHTLVPTSKHIESHGSSAIPYGILKAASCNCSRLVRLIAFLRYSTAW